MKTLPSETLPIVRVAWFSEDYLHHCHTELAVARYRGEATSPQENVSGSTTTSADYYVDVDSKTERNLEELYAADKPLHRTASKTKFIKLQ